MKVKVMIVDDNQMFREGMQEILEHMNSGFIVSTNAGNGKEAIQQVIQDPPDVILMDIDMPVMNGIEATSEILKKFPNICIIGFSMSGERWKVRDMIEAGAKGYVLKNTNQEELSAAISEVLKGRLYFSQDIAKFIR